jgi:glucoamylase
MRFVCLLFLMTNLNCATLFGQPTNRGEDAHWLSAAKTGFGTANTLASKVWFTLADGVMTEVFYPRLDVPNNQSLQLIVCTSDGCVAEEDMVHRVKAINASALSFRQVNSHASQYIITKTYITDPARATVLIHVVTSGLNAGDRVYAYFDPSLNNSGMHDSGWIIEDALVAVDGNVASALISSGGFSDLTNDFRGASDPLQQLKRTGQIAETNQRAGEGNIIQLGRVQKYQAFTLALGFGPNARQAVETARASLRKGFARTRREYEAGWSSYVRSLRLVDAKYERQFKMAAMVLKGLEDKTFRGAMIASPSVPWGGGPNANEPSISGYHAVWSRDLYHAATAFLAMGDKWSASRALDYLFRVQQRPDGSFPQNSWIDGRPIGNGLQMDQVALPIVLAYQLNRVDRQSWLKHIKPAANFIIGHGPVTEQDRWEEESGYSPATIAAEIAGLVCAARIAEINGDRSAAATYLKTADEWQSNVVSWTATSNGVHDKGQYYLRITEKGNPNEPSKLEINSGGGTSDQREIVDAGFLELVRLGIKDSSDPLISKSIAVVDKLIKVETPAGPGWYRYNRDAYGERADGKAYDGRTGRGRLWTLLTGERGEFELGRRNSAEARRLLDVMSRFANDGLMIPEQIWDESLATSIKAGSGTGSATPLAWSMAQFIRLAISVRDGRNVETPDIVKQRYGK